MPIHFEDLDVVSEVKGLNSVLIVPCNMCAAATVADKEGKPFLQLFRHFLKSAPFDRYIKRLQSRLKEVGVHSELFRCDIPHQWFLCLCTPGRRRKLAKMAGKHDAAIVLGCDSAIKTVRDAAFSTKCRVVPGMETAGIMNTRPKLSWSGNLTFENSEVVPLSRLEDQEMEENHVGGERRPVEFHA
jgi:hypothetical protein